jgi:hypothetical protein
MGRMFYNTPIDTPAQARMAGKNLMGRCLGCGHLRGFSAWEIECKVKDKTLTLAAIGQRMRCRRCRHLGCELVANQNLLECMMDNLARARAWHEAQAAERARARERETRELEASYRGSGWLDAEPVSVHRPSITGWVVCGREETDRKRHHCARDGEGGEAEPRAADEISDLRKRA